MLSKTLIIGNVGNKELTFTKSNMAILNLSVATTKKWNDKETGNLKEETSWHKIKVFGKMAQNCDKFLNKGSKVYIEGELKYGSYEKDGIKHYTTEIIANTVQFLDGKKKDAETQGNPFEDQINQLAKETNFSSDDIPF